MRYLKQKPPKSKPKHRIVTILIDDRERNPWVINHPDFKFETKRLKVADYTIKGFEDRVAIEKKSGIVELISNLSSKDRPRFKRFLEKLSKYPIKCIVIEDSLSHIEAAFRACPKSHLEPASIYYWLSVITIKYQIPVLFIGSNKQQRGELLYYLFSEIMKQLHAM
ncbi:hypothetical protein LCGC14_1466820 [marine sediment metagenome]|uniref:ERCC4 domain-containing protein n=1 Tax=marine sediment metagenome TaxID=412755 RepID=A0A0F9MFE9_9ZZZZ